MDLEYIPISTYLFGTYSSLIFLSCNVNMKKDYYKALNFSFFFVFVHILLNNSFYAISLDHNSY